MSIQLFSYSKNDLEKAVEIILNKVKITSNNQSLENIAAKDLLSQIEAAKFLRISIPTIISWRKDKSLPYYNFNGRYFYSQKELLEYGRQRNQKIKA